MFERISIMKRITALVVAALLLIALVACSGDGEESIDMSYPSRTAAFYGKMDVNSFWFTMDFTNNGSNCTFTQATNGRVVTTIEDFANDTYDKYHIYDKSCVHKLDLTTKVYNTLIGPHGQDFLFSGYTPSMFANPSSSSVAEFEGKSYYCESYATAGGGRNVYYFEGNTLKVIEIIEGGKAVMIMRINEYSNTIPENVYLSIPSDFRAGTLEYEGSDISFNENWSFGE